MPLRWTRATRSAASMVRTHPLPGADGWINRSKTQEDVTVFSESHFFGFYHFLDSHFPLVDSWCARVRNTLTAAWHSL